MLVFIQKFVSGSRKIKSTIEGLAFDTLCWAIMPDLLRTLQYGERLGFNFHPVRTVVIRSLEAF